MGFFDSFQTLAIANNFLLDKKILKIISNILKTSFENITFTDFLLDLTLLMIIEILWDGIKTPLISDKILMEGMEL